MVDCVLDVALRKSIRRTKKHDGYFEDEYSEIIKTSKEVIILDIGGTKFDVYKSMFASWPTSRLSLLIRATTIQEILRLCDGFYPSSVSPEGKTEYFFDRNWTNFNSILDIYRRGKLHCVRTSCAQTFYNDLEYWGFNELFLDPCCALDYYFERETCQKEMAVEKLATEKAEQKVIDEDFGTSCIGITRTYLWNLTEYPETSVGARVRTRSITLFYRDKVYPVRSPIAI